MFNIARSFTYNPGQKSYRFIDESLVFIYFLFYSIMILCLAWKWNETRIRWLTMRKEIEEDKEVQKSKFVYFLKLNWNLFCSVNEFNWFPFITYHSLLFAFCFAGILLRKTNELRWKFPSLVYAGSIWYRT
jgi:hypothetical protein